MTDALWKKRAARPYDEEFLVAAWLRSCASSREGQAAGAKPHTSARERFWQHHRPYVLWLLEHADVEVLCDPEDEAVIWAYACTSGDVVHACILKHEAVQALGLDDAAEMARDLMGDRLTRSCGYTFWLSDLARLRMLPHDWYQSAVWLAENYRRAA